MPPMLKSPIPLKWALLRGLQTACNQTMKSKSFLSATEALFSSPAVAQQRPDKNEENCASEMDVKKVLVALGPDSSERCSTCWYGGVKINFGCHAVKLKWFSTIFEIEWQDSCRSIISVSFSTIIATDSTYSPVSTKFIPPHNATDALPLPHLCRFREMRLLYPSSHDFYQELGLRRCILSLNTISLNE